MPVACKGIIYIYILMLGQEPTPPCMERRTSHGDGCEGQNKQTLFDDADRGFSRDNPMRGKVPIRPPLVATTEEESRMMEALEGYVPVFKRKEVTDLIKQNEIGGIDFLDSRLAEFGEWNSGEILLLQDIVKTIAEFMRQCRKEERPNLAKLEEKYNLCTKDYQDMYRSIAKITNGEEETCKWSEIVEVCQSIHVPQERCFQSATSIPALYKDARAIEATFQNAMAALLNEKDPSPKHPDPDHPQYLVRVEPGPMKKLTRLIEKTLSRNEGCACVMDVVRAMIVCKTNADICRVLRKLAAKDSPVTVWKLKEGFSNYADGQWVDIKAIVSMTKEDFVQKHKCELQIVHERMVKARQDLGGHWSYARYRNLAETICSLEGRTRGHSERGTACCWNHERGRLRQPWSCRDAPKSVQNWAGEQFDENSGTRFKDRKARSTIARLDQDSKFRSMFGSSKGD
jgi:hypothetical protein